MGDSRRVDVVLHVRHQIVNCLVWRYLGYRISDRISDVGVGLARGEYDANDGLGFIVARVASIGFCQRVEVATDSLIIRCFYVVVYRMKR